jgi:hypothetical protein
MEKLQMDPAFAQRNVNEGFSGGEKKRHEIMQLELLKPKMAILDETDSGLDIDALRVVSEGVNRVPRDRRGRPAADHPLHRDPALHQAGLRARLRGRQDRPGGRPELAEQLEAEGYERYVAAAGLTGEERMTFDVARVRADFPILEREVNGHPLVYLDSGEHLAEALVRCSRPCACTTSGTTATCPARCTRSAPRRRRLTRRPAPRSRRS